MHFSISCVIVQFMVAQVDLTDICKIISILINVKEKCIYNTIVNNMIMLVTAMHLLLYIHFLLRRRNLKKDPGGWNWSTEFLGIIKLPFLIPPKKAENV